MRSKIGLYAGLVAAGLALAGPLPGLVGAASAGCLPGEVIDKSTADDAKKKITAAGYTQVHDLKKGCDNVWHGDAVKNGAAVHVVLLPNGHVMEESN